MFTKIGAIITSGFGLFTVGKWLNKIRKVMGIAKRFFKETKEAVIETKEAKEHLFAAYRALEKYDQQNDVERAKTLELCKDAIEESMQAISEIEDVIALRNELATIFKK